MIIYRAQNKINEKIYIGQTRNELKVRIYDHVRMGGSPVFSKALKKYGIQNFEFLVIDNAKSIEELNEKEKYWIKFYNCKVPRGYNLTDGGEGINGYFLTQDQRERISISHKGKKNPSHSEWMRGENNPSKRLEVREKLSKKLKGRIISEESNEKRRKAMKGRRKGPQSEEHKKKISESLEGRSSKRKGKTYEELFGEEKAKEWRKKQSEGVKGEKNPMFGKKRR